MQDSTEQSPPGTHRWPAHKREKTVCYETDCSKCYPRFHAGCIRQRCTGASDQVKRSKIFTDSYDLSFKKPRFTSLPYFEQPDCFCKNGSLIGFCFHNIFIYAFGQSQDC